MVLVRFGVHGLKFIDLWQLRPVGFARPPEQVLDSQSGPEVAAGGARLRLADAENSFETLAVQYSNGS